jgi:predicted SPOUT superfamily RNA methylase MTH1
MNLGKLQKPNSIELGFITTLIAQYLQYWAIPQYFRKKYED